MSNPAISVVIPVYGVEKYIENCLQSLLAQTFRDFELILVDDGSRDRSIEIAHRVLKDASMPVKFLRQENQGQGIARDYGIQESSGEYVICVDSDDTVSPHFLEVLYAAAIRGNCDISFCGFQMVEEPVLSATEENGEFRCISRKDMLHSFLCRTIIPILPAMLLRRDMVIKNELSTYAGCRFSEDVFFMWLLFSKAEKICYTTQLLYYYLKHPGSTMTASSANRILTGYLAFQTLPKDPRFESDFSGSEFLLSRWVLGALNSSARSSKYPDFIKIAEQMEYRVHMGEMGAFPEIKARILAKILLHMPKLYYRILH